MANLVTSNSMQHQLTHNPAIAADIINAASSKNSKNDEVKKAKNINNLRGSIPIPTLHRHLLKKGYAFKKGRLHTGWKKRFFELMDDGHLVYRSHQNGKVLGDLYITKDTRIEMLEKNKSLTDIIIGNSSSNNNKVDNSSNNNTSVHHHSSNNGHGNITSNGDHNNNSQDNVKKKMNYNVKNSSPKKNEKLSKNSFKLLIITPERSLKLKFSTILEKQQWCVVLVHVIKLKSRNNSNRKRLSVYDLKLEHQATGYKSSINRLLDSCNKAVKTFTACGRSVRDLQNYQLKMTLNSSIEHAHRLICLCIKEMALGRETLQNTRDPDKMFRTVSRIQEACLSASFSCLSAAWKITSWLMVDSWSGSTFATSTLDNSGRFEGDVSRGLCKSMLEIFQTSSNELLLDVMEISTISNQGSGKLDIGNNEINNQTNNADDAANTTNNTIRKLRTSIELLNQAKARLDA